MATDFHTHRPKSAARSLVSVPVADIAQWPLASLQCHPWQLPEKVKPFDVAFLEAAVRAAALGEAGLDRLQGPPLEVQQAWLVQLFELANRLDKPVVIHCVRALPELLAVTRRFPGLRLLFHGYRGKPAGLESIRARGYFVSLGSAALADARLMEHLRETSLDQIGFESDDADLPIESILHNAAGLLGINEIKLIHRTDATFEQFLDGTGHSGVFPAESPF